MTLLVMLSIRVLRVDTLVLSHASGDWRFSSFSFKMMGAEVDKPPSPCIPRLARSPQRCIMITFQDHDVSESQASAGLRLPRRTLASRATERSDVTGSHPGCEWATRSWTQRLEAASKTSSAMRARTACMGRGRKRVEGVERVALPVATPWNDGSIATSAALRMAQNRPSRG